MTQIPVELPENMHAAVVTHAGGPENFEWREVPVPTPSAGQVLVETAAAGLNFIETYQRSGLYDVQYPFIPGSEASGTVIAVGEDVADVAVGDRVATASASETYAEFFVAPADKLLPVPDTIDLVEAAAIPLQGMTAHYLCRSTFEVKDGHNVFVTAGAGGVGQLLIQMCKHLGANVYTVASSKEKRQIALDAGADDVFDYDNFGEKLREITNGVGVDVVYDGVGADTFDTSLSAVRTRGMMVLFGAASGPVPPFDLQRLNSSGSLFVTRPSLAFYTLTGDEVSWRAGEIFGWLAEGVLKLSVDERFDLKDAADAHRALESRATTGKTVLIP
ncbi:quinone oxidoreductase family protein [Enteractinococcus coprophilus]|uniref:NADPH2:quinone reductase n=1 Tax=Enteractinococcus coprophilus TaxID=1027633 RepID=A0A543AJZ7_9MICC|nr:quinone oxidoreductase [Enteractinococcus coprophilus]TQL72899.1 NADPH2:quinone reductase [Enteractinococcus coprophilus]